VLLLRIGVFFCSCLEELNKHTEFVVSTLVFCSSLKQVVTVVWFVVNRESDLQLGGVGYQYVFCPFHVLLCSGSGQSVHTSVGITVRCFCSY